MKSMNLGCSLKVWFWYLILGQRASQSFLENEAVLCKAAALLLKDLCCSGLVTCSAACEQWNNPSLQWAWNKRPRGELLNVLNGCQLGYYQWYSVFWLLSVAIVQGGELSWKFVHIRITPNIDGHLLASS